MINVLPGSKNCEFLFTPGGGPLPLDNQYFPISESGGTLSIPLGPKQDGRGLMLPIAFDVVSPPQADCNASTTSHPADCTLMLGSAADPGLEMCVDAELVSGTQVREDP